MTDNLFGHGEWWEEFWEGMPEFVQEDQAPRHSIQFDFKTEADMAAFEKLIDQKVPDYTKRTPSIWWPEAEIGSFANKRWVSEPVVPRYPVYVPTKGRWESRFTIRALQKIGVPFRAVVEAQEVDEYARFLKTDQLLVVPHRDKGLVVTRNWIWDHAQASGTPRFWTMDDNIEGFWRLNRNLKVPVTTGAILRAIEDWADRWENVPVAGMNYFMFASRKTKMPPLILNTRVYSNMLIETAARDPRGNFYRNEGFYNDDTDLCLRMLKDGRVIALFNAFLIFKATTMTVKGGMTPHYLGDGRLKMAEELRDKHPDVTTVTRKWGRWQHHVDYSRFRSNRLIPKPGATVPAGRNEYGMTLHIDSAPSGSASEPRSDQDSTPGTGCSVSGEAHHQLERRALEVLTENVASRAEYAAPARGNLFGHGEWWEEHWRGMPEFVQEALTPLHSIQVDFKSKPDVEAFEKLIGGPIYHSKWTWYPHKGYGNHRDFRWVTEPRVHPRYPVYIISKGRADTRMTAKSLDLLGVDYRIVVEPQEEGLYRAHIGAERILVLPFSNLGQGSIPARNWVWDHAEASGAARHWILDDNIQGFYRLNRNAKIQADCGVMFRAAEDFVDRYENVAIAGFQYESFALRREKYPPFALNTRVYSCILIRNDLGYRWRGRYNEDTDLSLRALKDGWVTVLFNAFLANKIATMRMAGGNTDELYQDDGRLKMAESLVEQHPDVCSITWKWDRWQHVVDYEPFKRNALIPRAGLSVPLSEAPNEYGMKLTQLREAA